MSEIPIGIEVLLVDGRGCHREHVITDKDHWIEDGFTLAGECWRTLRFRVIDRRDASGRPVLRSDAPAIGRADSSWTRLYLPAMWHPPSQLTRALGSRRRTGLTS